MMTKSTPGTKTGKREKHETLAQKKARAQQLLTVLKETFPDAACTLEFREEWQLLFSAILAAQCTDARVNLVTEKMYHEWPELSDYAEHSREEIETRIRSCGLYRNKAKNIQAAARMLLQDFAGKVPQSMEDLLKLPGVGRKIANLMRGDAFGLPGIVVDTHCMRITRLMGLSSGSNPLKIERDLEKLLPEESWAAWGHLLVTLGRTICKARCRSCAICPLQSICTYGRSVEADIKALSKEEKALACL